MIWGINVIKIKARIIAKNKGSRGRITFSILVLAIPIPTNNTDPTGGVHSPTHRFRPTNQLTKPSNVTNQPTKQLTNQPTNVTNVTNQPTNVTNQDNQRNQPT